MCQPINSTSLETEFIYLFCLKWNQASCLQKQDPNRIRLRNRSSNNRIPIVQQKRDPDRIRLLEVLKAREFHVLRHKQGTNSIESQTMSTAKIQPTTCSFSSTVRHVGVFNLRLSRSAHVSSNGFNNHVGPHGIRRALTVSMSSAPSSNPLEICVKASVTAPNKLGDCKISLSLYPLTLFGYWENAEKRRKEKENELLRSLAVCLLAEIIAGKIVKLRI